MFSKLSKNKHWQKRSPYRALPNNKSATYLHFRPVDMDQSVYNRAIATSRKAKDLSKRINSEVIVNSRNKLGTKNNAKKDGRNCRRMCRENRRRLPALGLLLKSRAEPPSTAYNVANYSAQKPCNRHGTPVGKLAHQFSYVDLKLFKPENCLAIAKNVISDRMEVERIGIR